MAKTYVVTWTIELDAENPVDAARQAWACVQDPGSTANHFTVQEAGSHEVEHIDLEDEWENPEGEEGEDA